jgi:hypothetical protein
MPTSRTALGGGIEAIDQMNNLAFGGCNVLQDAHKFGARNVTDFAAPHGLHSLHGKVFKEQLVVPIRQLMRQLKEPVAATVDNALVDTRDNSASFLSSAGKLDLARKLLLRLPQCGHGLTVVQRGFNLATIRGSQESFQPKIEACAVTRHGWIAWIDLCLHHEIKVEIAQRIAFDCDRLDARGNIAALAVLVDSALKVDAVALQQLPPRLLERERTVLLDLLERGWRSLELALEVAKEQFVGAVNPLCNVLNGLRTDQVPVGIARQLLELGEMPHQVVLVQTLAPQTIVATVERNAMIVDQTGNVDLLVQMAILLRAVELELVGLGENHRSIDRALGLWAGGHDSILP